MSCTDEAPKRWQVFELLEIKASVTEYQRLSGRCDKCGKVHVGQLPAGLPPGILGPRAMAAVSVLSGKYRLSKRQVEELLQDFAGLKISLGTVSNTEGRVSSALADPVDEAKAHVKQQPVVSADETGHKVCNKKAWLWTAVTSLVTVFLIRTSRAAKVAKELLGDKFAGILVSDRYSAYSWVDAARRQLCWAHLIRDLNKIAERGGKSEEIANAILDYVGEMFKLWHRYKRGNNNRWWLKRKMEPICESIEALLAQGAKCGHPKTEKTCANILALKQALWTFVRVPGVEPTNNASEQAVRHHVLWRKGSFGTQSERGNLFIERILTVCATCKQQGRHVLSYVTEAVQAHYQGLPVPSLLPQAAGDSDREAA